MERTGGLVAKFTGDGVMALFGALVAHEDDPERAVRCGLSICERVGDLAGELHVRVGVTTGEVLVTLPAEGHPDAIGDVVNTAARLEAAAPVGGVLVDEWTFRATGRAIRYEEAAPVEAKGKSELWLPGWRWSRVRLCPSSSVTSFRWSAETPKPTRFVSRLIGRVVSHRRSSYR